MVRTPLADFIDRAPNKILLGADFLDRAGFTAFIHIAFVPARHRSVRVYEAEPFVEMPMAIWTIKLSLPEVKVNFFTRNR